MSSRYILHSPKVSKAKKKLEFSQKWLIACLCITLLFCALSYALSFADKNPVQELSIAIVNAMFIVDGSGFLAYALQNSVRAYSINKKKREEK